MIITWYIITTKEHYYLNINYLFTRSLAVALNGLVMRRYNCCDYKIIAMLIIIIGSYCGII